MAVRFDYATAIMRAKPGESFFIPTLRPQTHIPNIYRAGKELGREVQVKCVTESYINGIRTWILK